MRHLGLQPYEPVYAAMRDFTAARAAHTPDELWICSHPSVFTQGLAGLSSHVLAAGDIPVVQTNRGGQVTYHGPGQVVAYALIDLRRAGYFIKEFVYRIEESVIRTLADYGVTGLRVPGAPGIYVRVDDPGSHARLPAGFTAQSLGSGHGPAMGKIAALGVKVSRHCAYHGVALNVAMDLEPFTRINPCGYAGLKTVDLSTIGVQATWDDAAGRLASQLAARLAP